MARLIIHPGEHLADELRALEMSANELAKNSAFRRTGLRKSFAASGALPVTRLCASAGGLGRGLTFG